MAGEDDCRQTTQLLIADIEMLRRTLGIERWIVSGGSWGSTLALAYAEAHPGRCTALVLRGVFLGNRDEMHWVNQGMRKLFPLEWQRCVAGMSEAEQEHLHSTVRARVMGDDRQAAVAAATALAKFEWLCASVAPAEAAIDAELTPEFALPSARLLCHYVMNDFFLAPDQLLLQIDRIRHLPARIVQGRCDWKLYIIMDGQVRISRRLQGVGEEALTILGRGEVFGEMALIDSQPRSADAVAHTEGCTVFTIDRQRLEEVLGMDPDAARQFLTLLCQLLCRRIRAMNDRLVAWWVMAGTGS